MRLPPPSRRFGRPDAARPRGGAARLGMSRLGMSRLGMSRLGMSRLGMRGLGIMLRVVRGPRLPDPSRRRRRDGKV